MVRLGAALCVLLVTAAPSSRSWGKTPLRAAPAAGALVIDSATEGAEVFVDGEMVGTVPLPGPLPLAAGEHTLKVQKAGFAPMIDVIRIPRHGQTKMEVELVPISGALKVSANVEKARVFLDGKFVCEVPCTTEVPVGARSVQVSKGGYKDFFQNLQAVAGQELTLEVRLEELPVGINPYKPLAPPPAKWFEKWWVWTVGAVGVAVVVTAVVVPVLQSSKDPIADFHPAYTFSVGR